MKRKIFGKIVVVVILFLVFWGGIKTNIWAAGKSLVMDKAIEIKKEEKDYVPNEVIVKFREDRINLSSTSLSSQVRRLIFDWTNSYETEETLKEGNLLVLKIKEGQKVDEVIKNLMADPNVEFAEPNYYRKASSLNINDTYKTNLWGLDNSGQTLTLSSGETSTGTIGADIDMARAWALSTGTSEVIVAVIDSGVAYNHPDLIGNMWDGTNCVSEVGATLGDCTYGYDFVDDDKDPLPTNSSHGTHVAGIIAATQDNNKGIAGVGPKIKIMALKFDFDTVSEVKAINFAIQNGAKVINASFGGDLASDSELEAITAFRAAGGIFVAAAGNASTDNEVTHSYPSDYDLDNIISVAATNQDDELTSFSNFGTTSVDVAAPGVNIYSTVDEAAVLNYSFENLDSGSLPSAWTSDLGSSWGATDVGVSGSPNNVIFTDLNTPYVEGVNSVVTANSIDLSLVTNAKFEFLAFCDTEDTDPSEGGDYLALEVSSDGTSFSELSRINEYTLSTGGVALWDGYYDSVGDLVLDSQYFTNTFKYRLRWVTDNDGDTGQGDGCFIDDFKIVTYTDGSDEIYDYMDGTSMAAPHVSGLAGYLWSIKPSASVSEIVSSILDNGDTLPSLASKIVTGRRINAYNSILAIGVTAETAPVVTGLSDDVEVAKSKTFIWSSSNPESDQYRFSIDQIADGVPTGTYGTGTSTVYSNGTGTFYIHVQAKNANDLEGEVMTASFILDNTGPVASIGSSGTNVISLSFGENLYNYVGDTIADGSDLLSNFDDSSGYGIGISEAVYNNQTITIGLTGTPIAGSEIYLSIGSTDTNIFDNLGNASGQLSIMFDGSNWWLNPTSLNVDSSRIGDLITSGQLFLSDGSAPETALSVTTTSDLVITIGNSGTNSSVGLTYGTIISEVDDSIFDANLISGTEVDVTTLSNLEVGYSAQRAIQWGIPGVTLKFSLPIQIRIYLGSSFDGQTMNVYRSSALSSGWTTDSLSSGTCTVSGGYCAFAATEASYFVAASTDSPSPTSTPSPSPTSTPNNNDNNNNQSSGGSSGPPGPPVCGDRVPLLAPDLFRISTTKGSAKIVFTPVNEQITSYAVIYGLKKGDERYAAIFSPVNNNQGEQNFTINKLNPKLTYYFKVTAYNGCVSGPWSDWIPAKADRKREIHKYKTVIKNKIKSLVNQFK
jgi:subtilisin family serine protease